MTLLTQDRALRHVYNLHDAMTEMKAYGANAQHNLEEEALLFFRGTAEQLTQYWASAPAAYFQDPVLEEVRRHMLCQWDRGDVFEAAQALCEPRWVLEDALAISKGASVLRAHILGHFIQQPKFKEESMFAALGMPAGLLALGVATACADPLALARVEAQGEMPAEAPQVRLEASAGALKYLGSPYGNPSEEMLERTIDWAHAQWMQALEDGATTDNISAFLSALNHSKKQDARPMLHLLNAITASPIHRSENSQLVFEKLRDMIWSHTAVEGCNAWNHVLNKINNDVGMRLSLAPHWPMDLTDATLKGDPFMLAWRAAKWHPVRCLHAHAKANPGRMQLTDERLEIWMNEIARHLEDAKRVELGAVRWNERLLAVRMLLNTPNTWPLAWMTPQQQDKVQTWTDTVTPALDRTIEMLDVAVETHANNQAQMAKFLETQDWKACILDLVLAISQQTPQKPGARPRF